MNKKLLVVLGIAAVVVYVKRESIFGKKTDGASNETPADSSDIFSRFDNRIVIDSKGYWMLIKDGKINSPKDQSSLEAYVLANPGLEYLNVNEDIWEKWASTDMSVFGSGF